MPSTTRGSILISTANDIGSTLVDKLGGDGYTPEEWDSAANLCGIASADIATALSNIQESTPGGADRGSISIEKANSIGRILNKKFDTSRGFKPSEWASAIDKLTPLEIKSASGAIASFSDGADGVPVKSCSVSFEPSGGGGTPSAPVAIVGHSGITLTNKDNMSTPTHTDTYTDTFGQTIYGGTRDLTTDKASVAWAKIKLDANWTWQKSGSALNGFYAHIASNNIGIKTNTEFMAEIFQYASNTSDYFNNYGKCWCDSAINFNIDPSVCGGTTIQDFQQYITDNDVYICAQLATPTEITGLTPHEIDTLYGDNNIYADTGTTAVEYRADIDLALNA